jgi:xylulokinase
VRHVLGIDVSTTATKAVLIDESGAVTGIGVAEYPFSVPHPLWSEQEPRLWWDGAVAAIGSVLRSTGVAGGDITAIGLTGQMHGAVLLDAGGEVLRPAILWNDQRTGAECDLIREAVGPERLIAVTGNDALPGFTAPKLVWVRDHEPEVWRRIAHVLLPKDYVRLRLTGEYAVDKADGAGTLLFDLAARDWSAEVVTALGIDPAWLPRTWEGPEVTGGISADAAAATGLRPGTPVVAGGGDQAANAVGVGAVSVGTMALSLGTSGVVFATTERPLFEPAGRVHAFCHAVPGRWHMMSVMLSAAGSLRWFRDALAPDVAFDDLVVEAAQVPAGSGGLWFLPYLSGERSPHPDPLAAQIRQEPQRPARRPGPHGGGRHARPSPDPRFRGRHGERAVAADPGRRPRRGDRHGEHDRGGRVRGGAPRGGRGGLVPERRGRRGGARHGDPRGGARAGRSALRRGARGLP